MHCSRHWSLFRRIIINKLGQEIIETRTPERYEEVLRSLEHAKTTAAKVETFFRNLD